MAEQFLEFGGGAGGPVTGEPFFHLAGNRRAGLFGVEEAMNAALVESVPTIDPIAHVDGAVGPEIDVGRQHVGDGKLLVDHLEERALGFHAEGADAAAARTAAKIA